MNKYVAVIEGILFLSGEEGVTLGELISVLNVDPLEIETAIDTLIEKYNDNDEHGIKLVQTAQAYKFATKNEYADYFQKYAHQEYNDNIPKSSLETLAIIAYNQPITKFDIEQIKGVSPYHTLQHLLNRELVRIVGKSDEIGKPNLYGITDKFLDYLGINTLEQLPDLKDYEVDVEENIQTELFNSSADFKEIRKRLLNELNFEEKVLDLADDEIEVPTLKLFDEEETKEEELTEEVSSDINEGNIEDGETTENNSQE